MLVFRQALWLVLACLFFLFWARAFVTGERGYLAWRDMSTELQALQGQLELQEAENIRLTRRVEGLTLETLDLDLISELARAQSLSGGENDYLLIVPDL